MESIEDILSAIEELMQIQFTDEDFEMLVEKMDNLICDGYAEGFREARKEFEGDTYR